jgi:predicted CXXCH cytochrome family protein
MAGSMVREDGTGQELRGRFTAGFPLPARIILVATILALAATACWMVWTVRQSRSMARRSRQVRLLTFDRPFPPAGRYDSDPYVGSSVCSECHPGEAALHARSGHASTLRPPGKLALARQLDGTTVADPELPEVSWSYRFRDGVLLIARKTQEKTEECIADYAFGSGHHATTFVSMIRPEIPAILEHRLSYYAHTGGLGLTPGHNLKPPPPGLTALGGVPPASATRNCFGCHATEISVRGSTGIDEKMMIPNVTCERCHGPGRAHVAAARRRDRDSELSMPFGHGNWTAPELLRFCGDCHRHPSGPRPDRIRRGDPFLARFQPIGLSLSRCYRESAGTFSCVNCHDPHGRASSQRADYDGICLKCHGGALPSSRPSKSSARTGVACPVSPGERCVECHMPRVKLDTHLVLSDHWIRIPGKDQSPATDSGQEPSLELPDREQN